MEEEKGGRRAEGQRLNPSNVSFNLDSVSGYESGLDGNLCFPRHGFPGTRTRSVSSIEDVLFERWAFDQTPLVESDPMTDL